MPKGQAVIFERGIEANQRGIRGHGLGGLRFNSNPVGRSNPLSLPIMNYETLYILLDYISWVHTALAKLKD